MKKIILITCMIICVNITWAQNSIGLSVGYGFPAGNQLITTSYVGTLTSNGIQYSTKGIYGSSGSGIVVTGYYSHLFTRTVGIDVNVQYLFGKTYTGKSETTSSSSYSTSEQSVRATGIFFNPSLLMQLDKEGTRPYVKIGFAVGTVSTINSDYKQSKSNSGTVNTSVQEMKTDGGMPVGFTSAIGLIIPASDRINLFTEVNFMSMNYFPKQSELTVSAYNGVSDLNSLDVQQKKVIYKKEPNTVSNPDAPAENFTDAIPMGSVRLTVGINLRIGKS